MSHSSESNISRRGGGSASFSMRGRGGGAPRPGPQRSVVERGRSGGRNAMRAQNWRMSREHEAPAAAAAASAGAVVLEEKSQPAEEDGRVVIILPYAINKQLAEYLAANYPGMAFVSQWPTPYGHPRCHADRAVAVYYCYVVWPSREELPNNVVADYLGDRRVKANKNFSTDRRVYTVGGERSEYKDFMELLGAVGETPAYAVCVCFYSFDRSDEAWHAMKEVLENTVTRTLLVAFTPTALALEGDLTHESTGQRIAPGIIAVTVAGTRYEDVDNTWLGNAGSKDVSTPEGEAYINWRVVPEAFGSFRVAVFTLRAKPTLVIEAFQSKIVVMEEKPEETSIDIMSLAVPDAFKENAHGPVVGVSAGIAEQVFAENGVVHMLGTAYGSYVPIPIKLLRKLVADAVKIHDLGADAARSRLERVASGVSDDANVIAVSVAVARSVAARISMRASSMSNDPESKQLFSAAFEARYGTVNKDRPCCCARFRCAKHVCPTTYHVAVMKWLAAKVFPFFMVLLLAVGLFKLNAFGNCALYMMAAPLMARYGKFFKWFLVIMSLFFLLAASLPTARASETGSQVSVYHVVRHSNGAVRVVSAVGYGRSEHYPEIAAPGVRFSESTSKMPLQPVLPPHPISNEMYIEDMSVVGNYNGRYSKCYCGMPTGELVYKEFHSCDGMLCNKTVELISCASDYVAYAAVNNEVPLEVVQALGLLPGASVTEPIVPCRESNPQTPVCVLAGIEFCTPPHVAASTAHNEIRILYGRAFADKNPPINQGVMEQFTTWVKTNFLDLFNLSSVYHVVADPGAWFASLAPNKAKLYAAYDQLANASQISVGLPSSEYVRSGFVKMEMVMKDLYEKHGRLVQGAHASINSIVGPWVSRFSDVLHILWHHKYRSFFNGSVDAETEGQRHDHYVEQGYVPVSGDFSNFDSSQSEPLFLVLHWVYEQFGAPSDVIDTMRKQINKVGFTKCGYRYKARGTRASGDADTLVGNGIINYLVNLFSWSRQHPDISLSNRNPFTREEIDDCLAIYSSHTDWFNGDFHCDDDVGYHRVMGVIRASLNRPSCLKLTRLFVMINKTVEWSQFPYVVEHCGDDNLTYYKPECPIRETARMIAELGMTNNLTYNAHPEICSSLFWPTIVEGKPASVLSAKPGRLLAKIGHISKPFGKDLVACLAEKIYGTLMDVHHVPVLSQVLRKYLELIPAGTKAEPLYHKYKAHATSMHPITTAGVTMFCDRYNVTVHEYEEFIASLSLIKSLPWVHRHQMFDRLYEVDNEVIFRR